MAGPRPRKLKWSEQQELQTIEERIQAAEQVVIRTELQFADPAFYAEHGKDWPAFEKQLQIARENVTQLYNRWEELERIRAQEPNGS